jgi:hypothetical protein
MISTAEGDLELFECEVQELGRRAIMIVKTQRVRNEMK